MSSLSNQSLVARAQALFQAEAWADLAALLRPELEAEHRAPLWALQYGGAAAFHLGALQQAESLLKRAYQLRPQEGWTSYFLGRLALKQGQAASAVQFLQASVAALPEENWPHFFLLDALLRQGDWLAAHASLCRLLPAEEELLGLNRLRQRWISLASSSGSASPPIGLHRWALQLTTDRWLLIGWSTAAHLVLDPEAGGLDGGLPGQDHVVERFACREGRGWACFWQGDPPAAGWTLHGARQRPHHLDLASLVWPGAVYKLLACLDQMGLQERDLAGSLSGWLGAALSLSLPSSRAAVGLPHGAEVLEIGGVRHGTPELSVVIPLDRRWRLLRAQLMQLMAEPEMAAGFGELVVVLDEPEVADALLGWCSSTAAAFGIPFRLVLHPCCLGLAQACNSGAAVAAGRLLLLQKPEVFCRRDGWLTPLVQAMEEQGVGLVSPLVCDGEGAVRHAGVDAVRDRSRRADSPWVHRNRGLPWAGGAEVRTVPLLTLNTWLLDRRLFVETAGLPGPLLGDGGEDLIFCRRLQQVGQRCVLVPAVEMVVASRPALLVEDDNKEQEAVMDSLEHLTRRVNHWLTLAWADRDGGEI